MTQQDLIAPCQGKAVEVKQGQLVTITDLEGGQVADFFAVASGDTEEVVSPGVTMDCNASLWLKAGDIIYSTRYRPMFRVVADTVGGHDLLHPCCRPEMYDFFYQNGAGHPNCFDNINAFLDQKLPIIRPINLFMHTVVGADGSIRVMPPRSQPGDYFVLAALMDARVILAACSVSESDCNAGKCTAIGVTISDVPGAQGR